MAISKIRNGDHRRPPQRGKVHPDQRGWPGEKVGHCLPQAPDHPEPDFCGVVNRDDELQFVFMDTPGYPQGPEPSWATTWTMR